MRYEFMQACNPTVSKPMLFLDDASDGAKKSGTAWFLQNGVPEDCIVAVNLDPLQANAIAKSYPRVQVHSEDIWRMMQSLKDESMAGVWVDTQSWGAKDDNILHAFRIAHEAVAFTFFSPRQQMFKTDDTWNRSFQVAYRWAEKMNSLLTERFGGSKGGWKCVSVKVYASAGELRRLSMIHVLFERCAVKEKQCVGSSGKKCCDTPNCTLSKWHLGLHSFEKEWHVEKRKTRRTRGARAGPQCSAPGCTMPRGHLGVHSFEFCQLAATSTTRKRTIHDR